MACSLQQLNFASDMNACAWDAQVSSMVSFQPPLPVATTDPIIAELDIITSAISTPLPVADDMPSPMSDVSDSLFSSTPPSAPSFVGSKRSAAAALTPSCQPLKKMHMAKHEHLFEPVTPTTRKVAAVTTAASVAAPVGVAVHMPAPLSPCSQSMCTEEDADMHSVPPPTPAVAAISGATAIDNVIGLPVLSKVATAKRRALRMAAMKRSRSRRDQDGAGVKSEASPTKSESDVSCEPVDKKAARAIRNREAAMKSRVEAKQKMQKLQDENNCLNVRVKSLSEENRALTEQLKSLLQHTYGVSVADGQDVKEVFNMLAPVGCRG